MEKLIERTRKLLKSKSMNNLFFEEQNIIKKDSINPKEEEIIMLDERKNYFIYINKSDLGMLEKYYLIMEDRKTKTELKKERVLDRPNSYNAKRIKLKKMFSKMYQADRAIFDNILIDKENDSILLERCFELYINKNCKETGPFEDLSDMIDNLNEGYNIFKNSIVYLNFLLEEFKNTDIKIDLSLMMENISGGLAFLKDENFINNYIKANSNIRELFFNSVSLPFIIFDQEVNVNVNIGYKNLLDDLGNLVNLEPISSRLSDLTSITYSENEVNTLIEDTFSRIIKDIVLIDKDKALKEVIYEDYLAKIKNVSKRPSINLTLFLKKSESSNTKENNDEIYKRAKKDILLGIFDIHERRLEGFKRSVNRKVIQNVIEINSFKDLFPEARRTDRKIHFLCGETNSGKTYTAFEEACKHESGLYAAPLRLLALEGQQEFEKRGRTCSMITGEERDEKEDAKFISSTVEMIDYSKEYDVAIIDEVQLINDTDRGHAWFEAIVGINAKEIYLVGSEDIDTVLEQVVEYLGEKINKRVFKRKTKIKFDKDLYHNSLNTIGKLPKHSAVIAFGKSKVLKLKNKFESMGNKVAVIYGALPPEVRRIETERFVNGDADVIISTDAIGMGLNLPIENLFFFEYKKYNGNTIENLEVHLVKQIVGRAGRFNKFEIGYVSAMSSDVFNFIESEFYKDSVVTEKNLKCSPNYPIIKQIQQLTEENSIFKLLQNYNNAITFDFDIQNYMNEYAYKIARFIDKEDEEFNVLELKERVKIINAPVSNDRANEVLGFYYDSIKALILLKKEPNLYPYDILFDLLESFNISNQKNVEISIKKIDIFSWLAFNFEEFSSIKIDIERKKNLLNQKLIFLLRNT